MKKYFFILKLIDYILLFDVKNKLNNNFIFIIFNFIIYYDIIIFINHISYKKKYIIFFFIKIIKYIFIIIFNKK